jgi:putative ATP-dependent endonuclease of the OLD family
MFLAEARIRNYRCFADQTVEFRSGVNVLLGQNNGGKTTVIKALGLVLDQKAHRRPTFFDFHHPPADWSVPPAITVTLTFRSSKNDTVEDLALVATWLTKLDPPWEAQVTYTFRLEPDQESKCKDDLAKISVRDFSAYRRAVEFHLEKYVTRTYGGAIENLMEAERESLEKITLNSLDALRDAARELLTGTDPLLKRLLKQVRDEGKSDEQKAKSAEELSQLTQTLGKHITGRISLESLLQLVNDTGAVEGGKPRLADDLSEDDLLYALRLYVETNGVRIPAEQNGLGYNNLIYISLVLASLDHQADPARHGTNASIFPILSIEEPEAHLHPALQYKLLKHIEKRVRDTKRNRQVFITTHSTHITSASPLDQLIVFTIPDTVGGPCVAYPGKCFADDEGGKASKAYVERYLDATKSNLLFSKGIVLVEGIAEQLLLPVLAEHLGCSLEEHHVALIPVGGLTFKHFLPLFGAGLTVDQAKFSLTRPVACLVDADPSKKRTGTNEKLRNCYPYEVNQNQDYTYVPLSAAINALETQKAGRENILIEHGAKTLEYDLAFDNYTVALLVTAACTHAEPLRALLADPTKTPDELAVRITQVRDGTNHLSSQQRAAHVVAACYLDCIDKAKGEHALALAKALREAKGTPALLGFKVPAAIARVIRWASRQPEPTTPTAPAV